MRAKSFFLNDAYIDENIISNINSKYYSVQDFTGSLNEDSFTVFHSNLNGLENKFDEFQTFVNGTSHYLDVLCLTETSQKKNTNFNLNVNLHGYKQPFSLGSETARGGVAIYVNDKLKVKERNDINESNKNYEAIWIEIINKKTKNTLICCSYRHPKSDINEYISYINKCISTILTPFSII